MKQLFYMLIILAMAGIQSCSKNNLNLEQEEFLVTFLDQQSKCHGLLVEIESKDKERLRNVINEGETTSFPKESVIIGVFMLKGEYKKGQKLVLKLRKPGAEYTGMCTAEVMWYKSSFVVEERVYE